MNKYIDILLTTLLIIFFNGCVVDLSIDTDRGLVKTDEKGIYTEKWYINPDIKESRMLGSSTSDYGASAEKKRDIYIIKYFDTYGKEIPQSDLKKVKSSGKFWRSHITREQYLEDKKQRHSLETCFDRRNVFLDEDRSRTALEQRRQELGLTKYQSLFMSTNTKKECIKRSKEPIIDDWENNSNQFYYTKDENGKFIIKAHISPSYPSQPYIVVPIKQCFENGWCEVYPNQRNSETIYVKKSALVDFKD